MDKFRTFLTGRPCDLYLFDSAIHLNNGTNDESPDARLNCAFDHMMRIWEEVYLTLYSTRASLAGARIRAQRVSSMRDLAASWAQRYGGLMEIADSGLAPDMFPRCLELKYCYHVTQVLILRCDRRDHVQRQLLDHARACLRVITSIASMPATTLGLAALARMLQNYPIASFTELLRFHLYRLGRGGWSDEAVGDDVELLRHTSRSIKAMQHPNLPQTYLTRLGVGISWLLEGVEAVEEITRRSLSEPGMKIQPPLMEHVGSSISCPSSYAASAAMSTGTDSIGRPQSGDGSSLASSIPSSPEKGHRHALSEAELTSFGVSTPLTDPLSTTVGQVSSSSSSLYLEGPQFDTTMVDDQSWSMSMDLWREMFPS